MAMTAWSAKVLSERDLLVGERPNFDATNENRSDRQHPRAAMATASSVRVLAQRS